MYNHTIYVVNVLILHNIAFERLVLMKRNLAYNKTVFAVVILNITQIATLIAIIMFQFLNKSVPDYINLDSQTIAFLVLILLSFMNTFINIKDIYELAQINSKNDMLQQTLSQLEELNKTLRAQRHDFKNHLQVVYSLIELEEFKDTKEYIEKVYNDIQSVSQVMRTANPAINALLQAKTLACKKRDIELALNINTQLNGMKIPAWEFCRVLGNLIDNAIAALENISDKKYINIDISEDISSYKFRIMDNGSGVQKAIANKIFKAGFTTKGEKGEGMGLAIVKETLDSYGGGIRLCSSDGVTIFEGVLPKQP